MRLRPSSSRPTSVGPCFRLAVAKLFNHRRRPLATWVSALSPAPAATLTGLGAIALWSLLALFTAATGAVPPFQLTAMTFVVAGTLGLAIAAARGRLHLGRATPAGLALGLYGILGDTVLYFAALKLGATAAANLVHYLWPLLIVLFAALLPGGRLQPRHVAGAALGLAATALLVGARFGAEGASAILGYVCAFVGALVWASF